MFLYLDTGSLVKLFIEERHSDRVREWLNAVDVVLTCRVAYAEAVSAFSRRRREGGITQADYRKVMQAFDRQWESFGRLEFDERLAGELAARHALRGFDAIHLSAARMMLSAGRGTSIAFSSFDTPHSRLGGKPTPLPREREGANIETSSDGRATTAKWRKPRLVVAFTQS